MLISFAGTQLCSPHVRRTEGEHADSSPFRVPRDSLVIISIGSTRRGGLQEAQRATFGQHIHTYFFDESKVPECTICDSAFYTSSKDSRAPLFFQSEGTYATHPFFWMDQGWWCAQKRPLKALREVLQGLHALPQWVMVVDDDTFVDEQLLLEFITEEYAARPLLYGYTFDHNGGLLHGGAGWLVNDIVLKGLLETVEDALIWNGTHYVRSDQRTVLDGCIRRQNGGDWCFFHSDWAVGACVDSIGQGDVISQTGYNHSGKFVQWSQSDHQDSGSSIAVHYSDDKTQRMLYHNRHMVAGHPSPVQMSQQT